MKSYQQYCSLARALDVVGDRWVLLIVRELLAFGPSRYTDLKRGLPGIASNLLADRLKAMEAAGLIERRDAAPPVGTPVYRLTPRGRDLEDAVRALTRWGVPAMPSGPTGEDAVQPQWPALLAGLTLPEKLAADAQITLGVETGGESVRVVLSPGGFEIERGSARSADVTLSGPADLVGGVLTGLLTVAEATGLGLEVTGRVDLLTDLLADLVDDSTETGVAPVTYAETDLVATIEHLAARELTALSQSQLDGIDQFHSGGAEAVERLIATLGLTPTMTVLDVGSGLGGPARQVARATGCTVVGVDITRPYVEAAVALTQAAELADRVEFVCTDVVDLEHGDFDAAYTMHVQMNVADKRSFFTEIGSRLRPSGRLATFEVCRSGRGDPALPLPWTIDGTDSFMATPDELLGAIQDSGFETVEWVDETAWIIDWFHEIVTRPAGAATAATLPAILSDGPTRMMNFAAALSGGILTVHRGFFTQGRPIASPP